MYTILSPLLFSIYLILILPAVIATGYSFGNALADGWMATPSKYLMSSSPPNSNAVCETELGKEGEPTEDCVDNQSTSSHIPSNGLNKNLDNPSCSNSEVAEIQPVIQNDASSGPDPQAQDVTGVTDADAAASDDSPTAISPLHAFSRRHIAQLEVNLFDLLGHRDAKTGQHSSINVTLPISCSAIVRVCMRACVGCK